MSLPPKTPEEASHTEYYDACMSGNGYAFEVRWSATQGKHGVATQPVAADEELVLERPLVVWPHAEDDDSAKRCPTCLRQVGEEEEEEEAAACCSQQASAWLRYFPRASIAAARTWQRAHGAGDSVTLEAVGRAVARALGTAEMLLGRGASVEQAEAAAWQPFDRLCTPDGEMGGWTEAYRAEAARLTVVPEDAPAELKEVHASAVAGARVARLIGGIALNAHTVALPGGGAGSGVYTLTATLNHACRPAARVEASEPGSVDVAVRANRALAAGEEVSISYTPLGLGLAERRERLAKYGFVCGCSLCEAESSGGPTDAQ